MKKLLALLALIPAVAFGQGAARRIDTLTELLAINPTAFATAGKLSYEVGGYRTNGDWGSSRLITWDATSTAATNLGCVWAAGPGGTNGQWVAKDCETGELPATWFGATGDGVTDDTAALQAAIDWAAEQLIVNESAAWTNAFGATIRVPENKRFLHTGLTLKRGVRIIGRSPADKAYPNDVTLPRFLLVGGATRPSFYAGIYTNHLGNWEGPGNITLQGIVVDGQFDLQDTNNFSLHALHVDGGATAYAKGWNIEGCAFVDHVGFSIYAFRALGASSIRNCYLGNGLFTTVAADLKVSQCDITGRMRGVASRTFLNSQPFTSWWLADYTIYNEFDGVFGYNGPTNSPGQLSSIRKWTVTGYDAGTDVITVASTNAMHEGMPLVWRTSGTYPGGINSNFTYYPTFVGSNTLKISRIALWGYEPRAYDDITSGTATDDVLQFGETCVLFMNGGSTSGLNGFSNIRIQDGDDRLMIIDGASMNSFANLTLASSYNGNTFLTIRGDAYNNTFLGGAANALYPLVGLAPDVLVHLHPRTTGNRGIGMVVLGANSNNVLNASRTQPGNHWDNTAPWLDISVGAGRTLTYIDSDTDRTNNLVMDSWNWYWKRNNVTDIANTADMVFTPSDSVVRLELHGDQVPTQLYQYAHGGGSAYGRLDFTSTGGTRATNTATPQGVIAAINAGGHDGVSQTAARAVLNIINTAQWSTTNTPTEFSFEVTPSGTTSRVEVLRLLNSGEIVTSNTAPILTAKAGNGISGFRLNVLGGSSSLLRLQSNSSTVLSITSAGAQVLNTVANLTGGTASNFLAGNGAFKDVPASTSYSFTNGLTNSAGVVSWAALPGGNVSFTTNNGQITISSSTGTTNSGTAVSVDGAATMVAANFADSPELNPTASSSNVTYAIVTSSIATNKIDATFHGLLTASDLVGSGTNIFVNAALVSLANLQDDTGAGGINWAVSGSNIKAYATNVAHGLTHTNGLTNSAGIVQWAVAPGANITLMTNNGQITIAALTGVTNSGTAVSVDGASSLAIANLADSTELNPTATGSNITYAIVTGSITSNKISSGNITLDKLSSDILTLWQATNTTLTRLGGIGAGTSGDILYRDATGWTNLAKSSNSKVLTLTAGFPSWQDSAVAGGYISKSVSQTVVSNTTDETVLYTWTVPASTLSSDGDELEIYVPAKYTTYSAQPSGYTWTFYKEYGTGSEGSVATLYSATLNASVESFAADWTFRLKRMSSTNAMMILKHTVGANTGTNVLVQSSRVMDSVLENGGWGVDTDFALTVTHGVANAGHITHAKGYTVRKIQ